MTVQGKQGRSYEVRLLIAAAAASIFALAPSWLQPVLLPEILTIKGMTPASAGFVLTVEIMALALSSALYARIFKSLPFLTILIAGAVVTALGNGLSLLASDYGSLLATRVLSGLGEGAALMAFSALPARLSHPDRGYALTNIANILGGLVLINSTSVVGKLAGGPMTYPTMLVLIAVLLPFFLLLPARERMVMPGVDADIPEEEAARGGLSARILLIAAAALLSTTMNSALWPLFFLVGERTGLSEAALHGAMTIAICFALGSGVLVSIIGDRYGRLIPLTTGLVALSAASYLVSTSFDQLVFRAGITLYMLSLYFLVPYYYGSAAAEDKSGRGGALVGGGLLMAQAIGPYIGGVVSQHIGYYALGWLAAGANLIAISIFAGLYAVKPRAVTAG